MRVSVACHLLLAATVAAAVVMVAGKPTSDTPMKDSMEHMGNASMEHTNNSSIEHKGEPWHMEFMGNGSMGGSRGVGRKTHGSMGWGMEHMRNGSWGMGHKMPSFHMVLHRIHALHLCKGKPEERNCTARVHKCMKKFNVSRGNSEDLLPKAGICQKGDNECHMMYAKCLDLLTPSANTSQVTTESVICAVQDNPDCLTRMPECVNMMYPGRAAPLMPAEGEILCQGREDSEQCLQKVRDCRKMIMPFIEMFKQRGSVGIVSMMAGGMNHSGMMPVSDGAEPMSPACKELMNECTMMMRPGPDGPLPETEACHGKEGDQCSKKHKECEALMNQPPPPPLEMLPSPQHLCSDVAEGEKAACATTAMSCLEKLQPTPQMLHNLTQCLTLSSPCPQYPSGPEDNTKLKTCMEPALRAHTAAAFLVPIDEPAARPAAGSGSDTHHNRTAYYNAAYTTCFHDNTVMDVQDCMAKQCVMEGMKGV